MNEHLRQTTVPLVAQLHQLQTEHLKLTHEDTLVGVLPFFHIVRRPSIERRTFTSHSIARVCPGLRVLRSMRGRPSTA